MGKTIRLIVGITVLFMGCTGPEDKTQDYKIEGRSEDIVMVVADDYDIELLGRWPWPRAVIATVLEYIQAGGPKTVVLDIMFSEESLEEQDRTLQNILKKYDNFFLAAAFRENVIPGRRPLTFDNDYNLDPQFFREFNLPQTRHAVLPLKRFREEAEGIGSISNFPSETELFREFPLIIAYRNNIIPSLALAAACNYLDISPHAVEGFRDGDNYFINLGDGDISVNSSGKMPLVLPDRGKGFKKLSVRNIIRMHENNKDELRNMLEDKMVFVGANATGVQDTVATEKSLYYPGLELLAAAAENLVRQLP